MIAFIEGRVLFLGTGMMVVQTQSGVGYEIRVPETICLKSQSNQEIQLYIHTHVREDELTLYGFSSWEQKELFQMVIKTTGVGPKLGLAVLSQLSIDQLTDAVFQNNTAAFSQVSGIGRKTAAKLCLDLKDQLKNREMRSSLSQPFSRYQVPPVGQARQSPHSWDLQRAISQVTNAIASPATTSQRWPEHGIGLQLRRLSQATLPMLRLVNKWIVLPATSQVRPLMASCRRFYNFGHLR